MNYNRIYREFIANRRLLEGGLQGHVERHHIVPKSRGGSDDPENLIRLTPEDHFFAHLLLAKMYGGGMWIAVRRMRWGRIGGDRPWVRGRYMYAVAKRRQAEISRKAQAGQPGLRGRENPRYDFTQRQWVNLDTGETRTATTAEMWEAFGGSRPHWTSAVTGARKSMLGWTPRPEQVQVRSAKGKIFTFVNRDGRSFVGTQTDFQKHTGLNPASASRVARYQSVTLCGWRLKGVPDRRPNFAKLDGRPCKTRRTAA